ncbi:MAG: hypothetical protein AAF810_01350 [Cyanobacteria bacterium P01_D01_bin.36]
MISLSKFCQKYDLAKSTVYDRAKSLGLDTSNGLSALSQVKLCKSFGVKNDSTFSENDQDYVPFVELLPTDYIDDSPIATVKRVLPDLPDGISASVLAQAFDGAVGESSDIESMTILVSNLLDKALYVGRQKVDAQVRETAKEVSSLKKLETIIADGKTDLKLQGLESRLEAKKQTEIARQGQEAMKEILDMAKTNQDGTT